MTEKLKRCVVSVLLYEEDTIKMREVYAKDWKDAVIKALISIEASPEFDEGIDYDALHIHIDEANEDMLEAMIHTTVYEGWYFNVLEIEQ